ncbi:MAG: PD-(D/E)XK nuclease family protein [Betaproteobacteria bacterium]|nr:PD-(D/E)XK nuclease family protein [Betaproteobacteria bacterium]
MIDSLHAAIARGATVVTANRRLAREVVARHDDAQVASGRSAWPSARALPWQAFVGELWQQALDAGLELPQRRLDATQAAHLWQRIVATEGQFGPLLDAAATARLAAEAWERVHAYGAGGASWRGFAAGGAEVDAFVRWSDAFERETRRIDALDPARAADAVANAAQGLPGAAQLDVVLAGFVERTPQQERLLGALVAAGAAVERVDVDAKASIGHGSLHAAASPRDEIADALAWARVRAEADPDARVAIVVHDLHERRALVRALAEDVLCPGLQWPGREREPRPYDISAGAALADAPIVAAALDLVALAHGPLESARAAALLRSRFLPGSAATRAARAAVERRWLEQGRRKLTALAIAGTVERTDEPLARRWREAAAAAALPREAPPRDFVDAWKRWLDAAGWCEGAELDAAELAARGAWAELLADFVRLTAVAPRLTRDAALDALRDLAQAKPFEPEAPGARVRILGVLEAAGLTFDAAWVAGLAAETWPGAPRPNPLLPIDWQRERNVPHASAAHELAYARALTAQLDACAGEVVFSYAARIDDHASAPSPLIAHLSALRETIERQPAFAQRMFAARPALDSIADERAPGLPDGVPLRGGAALIEAQSACPFQAVGHHRLFAQAWPNAYAGLAPPERGRLVHAALASFWRETGSQEALVALDDVELEARLERAVDAGRAAIDEAVWRALPPVVAAVELEQALRTMKRWLLDVDRQRPAFRVESTETPVALTLAGHPLSLRIDRVDLLDGGARAVIDYKTGRAVAPKLWFGERPQAPQLALYAMALESEEGAPVAALAYAQLKPGEVAAVGLARDGTAWPGLSTPAEVKGVAIADWGDARAQLREAIESLAAEVHDGVARVTPRDGKVCQRCDLRALCRIASVDEGDGAADEPEEGA